MKFIRSFFFAWNGIQYCLKHEQNFRIEIVIAAMVFIAAFFLNISPGEWLAILICTALVLSLEMINTSIEKLCDQVTTDFLPLIKQVKDISAGAVLLTSLISLIAGLIIFLPKLKLLL